MQVRYIYEAGSSGYRTENGGGDQKEAVIRKDYIQSSNVGGDIEIIPTGEAIG